MHLKLYLIIISICSLLTSLFTSIYYDLSFIYVLSVMWIGIILVIIIDGLTATICRLLPKRIADFNKKIYLVNKKEKVFYEKIKKGGPCNEEKHDKQAAKNRNKTSFQRPYGDGEIGVADARGRRRIEIKCCGRAPQIRNRAAPSRR